MKRHLVGLCTDIVIDFPVGLPLDQENPKFQEVCREQFIDFLQSADQMTLSFQIDPEPEEDSKEKVDEIKEVLYKLHDGKIFKKAAYVFSIDGEVYIEEADAEASNFRLEQEDDGPHIHVLEGEDYWINEEVTELFDTGKILELCEKAKDVPDESQNYVEWIQHANDDELNAHEKAHLDAFRIDINL
jgi:hypothetical protein